MPAIGRGTAWWPPPSGASGPGTPAPRSTRIRGHGMRSASPARPIREATRTSVSTDANRSKCATRTPSTIPRGPPMADEVRERNESAWLLTPNGAAPEHRLREDMRRFEDEDTVDLVIIGCGAGGSTLLQRAARAGWSVVALDAGPFWNPE